MFLSQCQTAGVEQHWGGLKDFGAPGPEQEDPRGSCMQQKGQIHEEDRGEMMGQPHLSISRDKVAMYLAESSIVMSTLNQLSTSFFSIC